MAKNDWEEKAEKLRAEADRNNPEKGGRKRSPNKICPFMSTPDADRECSEQCKLYRAEQKNYECYFMALQSISWNLKHR